MPQQNSPNATKTKKDKEIIDFFLIAHYLYIDTTLKFSHIL